MKILHVIPDSAVDPQLYYHGSTKDVLGRTEYFASRSMDFEQLIVTGRSDEVLLNKLSTTAVASYSHIIIELPIYPKSMEWIRKNSPTSRVYCRPINAEFYHKLHAYWCAVKGYNEDNNPFLRSVFMHYPMVKESLVRLRQDYRCGNLSNIILSITDWESQYYWRYLVGKKAETLPFFLPAQYAEEIHANPMGKENLCVSFMGVKTMKGSFLNDSLNSFCSLITQMGDDFQDWSFRITGDLPQTGSPLPSRAEATGFLKTPYPLLAQARAIAILSPYGFGFKTKILEAILCGCYVILPLQLKKRLPEIIKPFCIAIELDSIASFKRALIRSLEPFPEQNPNILLREEAFGVLDKLLY